MASSVSCDHHQRRATRQSQGGAPSAETEQLPCPRCDSTNTKFCYYNNYNFSQPRHFCKSCRRYWTRGGTLRDIPVGGGSRKNAKRSRISGPSTASAATATASSRDYRHVPTTISPLLDSLAADHGGSLPSGDVKAGLNVCGSFTSLLTTQEPAGLFAVGGFGLEVGSRIGDVAFGLGKAVWPFTVGSAGLGDSGADGVSVLGNTWQLESAGFADCFTSPDLAISTRSNGMKSSPLSFYG